MSTPETTPDDVDGARPRPTPCASCPYRRNAPSGVWHESEYAKLPRYDADTGEQPIAAFRCHHADETICAGWLGYGDPSQLLAVRIGIMRGNLHPSCADYVTDVPLFDSGAAAAEHGLREIEEPGERAQATIGKLVKLRQLES